MDHDPNRTRQTSSTAIDRRKLLMASGAAAVAVGIGTTLNRQSAAQTEGQGPATPNPIGSPVPEEVLALEGNWPLAQGNLATTRQATQSALSVESVAQLGVAWTVPITVSGNFSGITAHSAHPGRRRHLQDMQCNMFAL